MEIKNKIRINPMKNTCFITLAFEAPKYDYNKKPYTWGEQLTISMQGCHGAIVTDGTENPELRLAMENLMNDIVGNCRKYGKELSQDCRKGNATKGN